MRAEFREPREAERIFLANAEAMSAYPFDEVRLRQMIAATRQDGYAYNNIHVLPGLENVTEMAGIGVPNRRRDGAPVAALHLTGVTSRLDPPRRDNLVATLRAEARAIERSSSRCSRPRPPSSGSLPSRRSIIRRVVRLVGRATVLAP